MRKDPPAERAQWRPEAVEAPVRLDLLVRDLMAERRAHLTAEDAARELASVGQKAEEDAVERLAADEPTVPPVRPHPAKDALFREPIAGGRAMERRPTTLQRQFDEGALLLPDIRPVSVSERAWLVLVRHVRDHVPYATLAAELGLSDHTAGQLAAQAAAALRYPDLADLPSGTRRALVLGGYTSRAAIAQASNADLLSLNRLGAARLRAVRAVVPRAE